MQPDLMQPHISLTCSARPSLMDWRATALAAGAIVVATMVGSAPGIAQTPRGTPASTVIVLDGSNSMNAKLGGDAAPRDAPLKHVMVREALRSALGRVGPDTQVGLASFGHRRPSDCTDVDLVQPPSTDIAKLVATLEKFQPKGFSPVVLAMRTAAKGLSAANPTGSGGGKSSLIIVLDDLASCRGEDPCKVAGELKRDQPALAIHVVGLGLRPADAQVMACVAQASGGRLFDAQDVPAAIAAIDQALQLAAADGVTGAGAAIRQAPAGGVKGAPKVAANTPSAQAQPAPMVAPVEKLGPGLHLSARLADGRTPLEQSVRWRIVREGAAPGDPATAEATQPRLSLQLPNGRYQIEAQAGLVTVNQSVEITSAVATPLVVAFPAGVISLSAPLQKGGEPSRRVLLSVFQATTQGTSTGAGAPVSGAKPVWLASTGADDLVVPPGTYRIVAEDGLVRVERTVTIALGVRREVELALGAGRLVVDANLGGNDPLADNVQFIIEEDDPDSPNGKKEILRTAAPRLDLTLPAGSYQVTARRGAAEARERLSVKAGEDTSRSIALAAGRVRLASRFASTPTTGVPIVYRIERIDGPPRTITRGGEAEPVIDLSPGRYRFESRIGGQNAIAVREIDVRGGIEQRVDLNPSAGGIRLKLAPQALARQPGGLGFGEVFWQIVDDRGQSVWRTSQVEPQLVLTAGRYSVTVELKDRSFERTFDVKAGDNRVLDVNG